MSSVYIRYLLPALIVACTALALFVGRRRGHARAVLRNSQQISADTTAPAPTDPGAEEAWHALHGAALVDWMTTYENVLELASADGFSEAQPVLAKAAALAEPDGPTGSELEWAVAAHPNPFRRAELSAMRAAARSTLVALEQSDYPRARRHYLVYRDYRDHWRQHAVADQRPARS